MRLVQNSELFSIILLTIITFESRAFLKDVSFFLFIRFVNVANFNFIGLHSHKIYR